MENAKDSNYNHAKRICHDFEIKNSDEDNDLHLKSDILLSADVFIKTLAKCVQRFMN